MGRPPTYWANGTSWAKPFAHTCHKTDNRQACDGPRNWQGERPQHCAGALMMLLKTGQGHDLQIPMLNAMQEKKFDIEEMTARAKADDRVFTVRELLRFYATRLNNMLRRRKRKAKP